MQNLSPLVLLAPRVTEDSISIWKAAIEAHWPVERLPNWRVPERLRSIDRDIVIYAEPLFAEAIADQLNLALIEPTTDWLTTIPIDYLRREVRFSILSKARLLDKPTFVKPAEGKVFEPKVFASGDTLPTVEQIGDIPVLTSTPVSWDIESRCFVLERRIVTMSPYWRNGELARDSDGNWPFVANEEPEARQFLSTLLADAKVTLPSACVIDIGLITGAGWAVIEANPSWGAGLYGCSPMAVLNTIRRAVHRRDQISSDDRLWVSTRNQLPPR